MSPGVQRAGVVCAIIDNCYLPNKKGNIFSVQRTLTRMRNNICGDGINFLYKHFYINLKYSPTTNLSLYNAKVQSLIGTFEPTVQPTVDHVHVNTTSYYVLVILSKLVLADPKGLLETSHLWQVILKKSRSGLRVKVKKTIFSKFGQF